MFIYRTYSALARAMQAKLSPTYFRLTLHYKARLDLFLGLNSLKIVMTTEITGLDCNMMYHSDNLLFFQLSLPHSKNKRIFTGFLKAVWIKGLDNFMNMNSICNYEC